MLRSGKSMFADTHESVTMKISYVWGQLWQQTFVDQSAKRPATSLPVKRKQIHLPLAVATPLNSNKLQKGVTGNWL